MQIRKLAAMAGTALLAGLSIATPALATTVTQLTKVTDMVTVSDGEVTQFPLFVYGAAAASSDMDALQSIADSFSALAVEDGVTTVAEGSYQFTAKDDPLHVGRALDDLKSTITETELPELLGDGEVKIGSTTYEFVQKIKLEDSTLNVDFMENDNDELGLWLTVTNPGTDATEVYTYELNFRSVVKFDDDEAETDLMGESLNWLGGDWTIVGVTENTSNIITEIQLVSGKASDTINLGTPQTFTTDGKTYTVELLAVGNVATSGTDDPAQATVNVDGKSYLVDEGETVELPDGTEITVTDIFGSTKESTPDSCKIYIGARKLILEDGEELDASGETVDGVFVDLFADTPNEFDGWSLQVTKEAVNADDDLYVGSGDSIVDPITENFAIQFNGIIPDLESSDRTLVQLDTAQENAYLTFTNVAGTENKVPLFYWDSDAGVFSMGKNNDTELFVLDEANAVVENNWFVLSYDTTAATYLAQLSKVDDDDATVTIDVEGLGEVSADYNSTNFGFFDVGGQEFLFEVTDEVNGEIEVDFDKSGVITSAGNTEIYTEFGKTYRGVITVDDTANGTVTFTEKDADQVVVAFNVDTDDEFVIDDVTGALTMVGDPDTDVDLNYGITEYGTYVKEATDGTEYVKIFYPEDVAEAQVFLGLVGSTESTSIDVGFDYMKLDSEVTDADKSAYDMVLGGGPCVNTLVAALAAEGKFPYTCATWPAQDFGKLQLVNNAFATGKTVLIVAGTRAADTTLAANVVADGTKLTSGLSATVSGSSISSVIVE